MKYTAINIGPIIKTLGMARKPRELWAASYLFSYLMKTIVESLPKDKIISPATIHKDEKNGIGLYPDRVFVKDYEITYENAIKPKICDLAKNLNLNSDYFNIMITSGDYEKDSEAIRDLNRQLDILELFNMSIPQTLTDKINLLIKYGSALFEDALGSKDFPVESLGEIAATELSNEDKWSQFVIDIKSDDKTVSEKAFNNLPKDKLKSYHKYICVVQADGDNVGKTVSHPELPDGKVLKISKALLDFGKAAKKVITDFGGLPIYAGGDDLLFIAPVIGKDHTNILDLLNKLNDESFKSVKDVVDECNLKTQDEHKEDIHASLSFGVSITYFKYPLYEALESARTLLFDNAKTIKGKNAIVVDWRKHSGGAFQMSFSRTDAKLEESFKRMIDASSPDIEESVVSAIAHKIRENEGILDLWIGCDNATKRNTNFFKKYLEHNPEKEEDKKTATDKYKDTALALLNELFAKETEDISKLTLTMYGMLRMAKFFKGEEVKDE